MSLTVSESLTAAIFSGAIGSVFRNREQSGIIQ
jgi:hypothetical protein